MQNPEASQARRPDAGPDRSPEANVGGWLGAQAGLRPGATAVALDATGERISYGALNKLSNRVAALLASEGLRAGDRVALLLRSEPLYLAIYFAAAKLGLVLIPLNSRLTARELGLQLDDAEPRLVIRDRGASLPARAGCLALTRDELCARLPERAAEPALAPGGEAPQVLMYTSGTTGVAKGALLPHRKTLYNTRNAEIYFALRASDVVLVPVPLFHSYGLKVLSVPALFAGASIVLVDRFDPIGLQDAVARWQASLLGGVPVMYQRMLRAGLDRQKLACLRFAFSAGAALDGETIRAYFAAGISLRQGYGQTETSILCAQQDGDGVERAGGVGRPVRHGELRIADSEGRALAAGTSGEILVRGPLCMLGYWRRPQETQAATLAGWHRTGDLGVMDADGHVRLVGRLKEMYISGGENVYPAEVEHVLEEHPNVAEAAVLGVPDPEWGETGVAFVVPVQRPLDVGELLRFARERLAGYKIPRRVSVVDELPRTASGKVQKARLV